MRTRTLIAAAVVALVAWHACGSEPAAATAIAPGTPTIEQHFAHVYPPAVLASYTPTMRRVLEQRMRAEQRRAAAARDPVGAWSRDAVAWIADRVTVARWFWNQR